MTRRKALFAYGTLMDPGIWQQVVGRSCPAEPAVLKGWVRWRVRGAHYPAIWPKEDASVEGLLYTGLHPSDFARLDAYEGDEYQRIRVSVATAAGPVTAEVYRFRPTLRARLLEREWR